MVAGFRPVTKMLAMTGNPWETVKSFRGRLAALLCLLQGSETKFSICLDGVREERKNVQRHQRVHGFQENLTETGGFPAHQWVGRNLSRGK